jgi:hypothetical protein
MYFRNCPFTNIRKTSYLYCDVIPNKINILNPSILPRDFKLIGFACSKLLYVGEVQQQIKHGVPVYS